MSTQPPKTQTRDCLTEEEAQSRGEKVRAVHYTLRLSIDETNDSYKGHASIRFELKNGTTSFVDFTGGAISEMLWDGSPVSLRREPYRILLPEVEQLSTSPGHANFSEHTLSLNYENAYDTTGVGLHRFVDPEDESVYLYTDFEPFAAHRLFPCFDQPDLKATYDLELTAPEHWVVLSNGAELFRQSDQDGNSVRKFQVLEPFSTYLVAVVAGPFASVYDEGEDDPAAPRLGLHCRKSLEKYLDHEEVFEITRQGFEFYEREFAQKYPFGKYDQIFVPEYNSGAMENVGCVTFNEAQVFRDPPTDTQRLMRAEVVLHELAHMWFGNLVTMKWWDGLWLNESFATYISFVAMTEATRFHAGWENFLGAIKSWAYREDQKPSTHPIATSVRDTDETFLNFDGITYGKGAAVLKQLIAKLGREGFRKGIQHYFARHAYGNTTIGDFLEALGEGAGRDLSEWSSLWLETSGVNTLVPERTADGGCAIHQTKGNGDQILRPHTLEVGFFSRDEDAEPTQAFAQLAATPVQIEGATTSVVDTLPFGSHQESLIWANHGDHAFARVFLDEQSLGAARSGLGAFQSSLLRMGLWGTFWEMMREGALRPSAYLDLGAQWLPKESDTEILESSLGLCRVVLGRYLPPDRQGQAAKHMLEALLSGLNALDPKSDQALIAARSIPGFLASEELVALSVPWLQEGKLGGVAIDQGLRWSLLLRHASFNFPGIEQALESEAQRDPSNRGVKAKMRAAAALPDPESKAYWWKCFVYGKEYSADLLKAAMGGFFWPHQSELLQNYAAEFFDVLPKVVDTTDLEYATRGFARYLLPHALATPKLLSAAQRAKKLHGEHSPVLKRLYLEELDELNRAVRLRKIEAEA